MKKFNFEEALKKGQNMVKINWLKENHKKPISEFEFVKAMRVIKQFRNGKSYKYQPSSLKRRYYYLKKNFGFFG